MQQPSQSSSSKKSTLLAWRAPQKQRDDRVGWFDLPFELREPILKECLIMDSAIELCPEPFEFTPGSNNGKFYWQREAAKSYQRSLIKKGLGPYIGLLEVSKQMHYEAALILFGHNEFRFSNCAGWLGLEYFLYHIDRFHGRMHCDMLRHVTIIHPEMASKPDSITNAGCYSDGLLIFKQTRTDNREHCQFRKEEFGGQGKSWWKKWTPDHVVQQLSQLPNVRKLTWVVPPDLKSADISNPVPETEKLQISIVRKNRGQDPGYWNSSMVPPMPWLTAESLVGAMNVRYGTKWTGEEVQIDRFGNYKKPGEKAEDTEDAEESDKGW